MRKLVFGIGLNDRVWIMRDRSTMARKDRKFIRKELDITEAAINEFIGKKPSKVEPDNPSKSVPDTHSKRRRGV